MLRTTTTTINRQRERLMIRTGKHCCFHGFVYVFENQRVNKKNKAQIGLPETGRWRAACAPMAYGRGTKRVERRVAAGPTRANLVTTETYGTARTTDDACSNVDTDVNDGSRNEVRATFSNSSGVCVCVREREFFATTARRYCRYGVLTLKRATGRVAGAAK